MKKPIFSLFMLFFLFCSETWAQATAPIRVSSPDGRITMQVFVDKLQSLRYSVQFNQQNVLENSALGLTVDGIKLGEKTLLGTPKTYELNESYPWRGIVHSTIKNHCTGTWIPLTHTPSGTKFVLEVRVFDDGLAFRYSVPAKGGQTVSSEATSFKLPANSQVWYHDFHMHYEGQHQQKSIADVAAGEWVAPPLTIKLPAEQGYAAISESAIINYSGMGLQADGKNSFLLRLGHEQPVSYPYELRYPKEDIERLAKPASLEDPIISPWRVVMIAKDLNALVNCDIVHNVAPAADTLLFPNGQNEAWLKPGRAVWGYLTAEPRTLDGMKNLSRLAGELGFEYHIVEGHWANWTFEQQKDLVDYSKKLGVKIILWKHSKDLHNVQQLKQFFKLCHDLGAAGAKIDFFDHEAKEVIDLYQACLLEAAQYHLVLDFHGANKPAGESRAWPNELAREAIKGFETRGPFAKHNATLPFTRMLVGHADYTPLHFGDRRCETSEAHQIASAIVLSAPMLVYAEHPENILKHPAAAIIKQIPATWDETIVLPCSSIGEVSAIAKRSGDKWFISVMNGESARIVNLSFPFLNKGEYKITLIRDKQPESAFASLVRKRLSFGAQKGVLIDAANMAHNDALVVELIAGGGFVALLEKVSP